MLVFHSTARIGANRTLPTFRRYSSYQPVAKFTNTQSNTITFPDQTVYAGSESLLPFVSAIKTSTKRPLIVTDKGLQKLGVPQQLVSVLTKHDLQPAISDDSEPNPSCQDVVNIALTYVRNGCDSFIGLGGGGPLDAMKISAALIAQSKLDKNFNLEQYGVTWVTDNMPPILKNMSSEFKAYIPPINAIPTTAGTGSEGGKSAVIVNPQGQKKVYGNPAFMPKYVALAPQLTEQLPPLLTAATGIDALSHLLEAWFVPPETVLFPEEGGPADGYLSKADVSRCDNYALEGISLIAEHLPAAFRDGSNLTARLYMQVAALLGAKAFRKGDLGGIHATAHSVGAFFHLHHGTAIGRMMVPVLKFNESKASPDLIREKFEPLKQVFTSKGYSGSTLSACVTNFMAQFPIPTGLKELPLSPNTLEQLSELAHIDPCQTNPVSLTKEDYRQIFDSAI